MTRLSRLLLLAAFAMPLAAHAATPYGRAGLWVVTSTAQMAPIPRTQPEALSLLRGLSSSGAPVAGNLCVTDDDIGEERAPRLYDRSQDCRISVTAKTPSAMTVESVCYGTLEGKGRMQIAWQGSDHFSGSYSFRGKVYGRRAQIASSFRGDFAGVNCGGVKPFIPFIQP